MRVALAVGAVLAVACQPSEVGVGRAAIVDGEPAPDAEAVVAVIERAASCTPAPPSLRCTGALVGPRAVLTAAHCLGDGHPADLAVLFDGSLGGAGARVPVARSVVHPEFDPETRAHDRVVLVLEADAPAGVAPLPLASAPIDASWVGATVRMVGFGGTDAEDLGAGERRQGDAIVDAVEPAQLRLVPGPAMSCRGDSGGPVLSEAGEVLAVTSSGDPACAEHAIVARVDSEGPFLEDALAEALRVPEPRRAFDPTEHFCDRTCEGDGDCPEGTVCFGAPGAPRRCVLPGLAAGELLGACTGDRACGAAPCVSTPAGCRCYLSCGFHSHADAGVGEGGDSGGCAAGGSPIGAGAVLWLLLGVALGRRPRGER